MKNYLKKANELVLSAMASYEANKHTLKRTQRRMEVLSLLMVMSLFAFGQDQEVRQIANIIIGAFSAIVILVLLKVGAVAFGKFSNNEPKEAMAYMGGMILAIVVWIVVVKNARALANFTKLSLS